MKLGLIFKAARVDFIPASIVPFFIGAAYAAKTGFPVSLPRFLLGLIAVSATHLSANLLNDYYDYKSGADNQAAKVSSFFGGSKVIQKGIFTDRQVLKFSLFFLCVAVLCVAGIFAVTKNPVFLILMAAAGILAVEYTAPPLKLSYKRLGEIDIFLLFGVGLVMGSFYLFSGTVSFASFLISLPIAFLVGGVIICNEVPDFQTDNKVNKLNLLSLCGIKNGYILYGSIIFISLLAIFLNIAKGILPLYAVLIGMLYYFGIRAFLNLRNNLSDTNKLIQASRFTIMQHAFVGIAIILALLFS